MEPVPIKPTPSYLYNNLSSNGQWSCFVSNSEVYLLNDAQLSKKQAQFKKLQTKDASPIHQVKWIKISGKYYIVLALKNSLQV